MHRRTVIKLGAAALAGSSFALLHEPTLTLAAPRAHAPAQQPRQQNGVSLTDSSGLLHFFTVKDGNVYRTSPVNFDRNPGWTPWYNHGSPAGRVVSQCCQVSPKLSYTVPLRLYVLAGPLPNYPESTATTLSLYYLELNGFSGQWSGWQPVTPAHTIKGIFPLCAMTIGKT